MKRFLSAVLVLIMLISSFIFAMPTSAATFSDATIRTRIDTLYNLIGNTYFNVGRNTACGQKYSGHACKNCYNVNVIATDWFKNMFGTVSASNLSNHYGYDGTTGIYGYSCFGFANFAEWYLFKSSNSDKVTTVKIGTVPFNYTNMSKYAKVGDVLRLNSTHSVIFISADSSGIEVLDSNWSASYNCLVQKHKIYYSGSGYSTATISREENRAVGATYPTTCTSHTKGTFLFYESVHPHYNYYECSTCGANFTDNSTRKVSSCTSCSCTTHVNNGLALIGPEHPHYDYYTCSICGASYTNGVTNRVSGCNECPTDVSQFIHVHKYNNLCDATCNECGEERVAPHYSFISTFNSSAHYEFCNICLERRNEESHKFDNPCDKNCNVCGAPRETSHLWSEYINDNNATETSNATETRTCSLCGEKESRLVKSNIDFEYGSGTEEDPYLISTKRHLNNVRNYLDSHFKLVNDIEFTDADFAVGGAFYNNGAGFMPIGTDYNNSFTGTFDGNGYTIKNLYINNTSTDYTGLFGSTKGSIKNLGVINSSINSEGYYTGGIVGYTERAEIVNCYTTGSVNSSDSYIGGIAGCTYYSPIINCYNTGSVTVSSSSAFTYAGGIVGYTHTSEIINCYNTGNVSNNSSSTYFVACAYAGGIEGCSTTFGSLKNSYNTGNILVNADKRACAGGITAYAYTVTNCYNSGYVKATSSSDFACAGGVAGENNSKITNCYNLGGVSATTKSSYGVDSGGVVGENYANITHCYSTNDIYASASTTSLSRKGGVVGYNSSDGYINDCYYINTTPSGYELADTAINKGTVSTTGCTESQMKEKSTFAGFDFENVWTFNGFEIFYPVLRDIHYEHEFDGNCDAICNICGYERITDEHKIGNVTFENDATYPFELNGDTYSSTNTTNNSKATLSFKVPYSGTVKINYCVSSEKSYDKFIISHNDTDVVNTSGEIYSTTKEFFVVAGDVIYITYSKDSSQSKGNDKAYFKIDLSDCMIPAGSYNPTCEQAVECDVCGETVKDELGHLYVAICDNTCDRCGQVRAADEHIYDNACDTDCYLCGNKREITHDYFKNFDIRNHYDECSICGEKSNNNSHYFDNDCDSTCNGCNYIRTVSHSWSEYVYNGDATTEADGTKTRTCESCGDSETITAEGTKLPEVVEPETPSVIPDSRLPKVEMNESGNGVSLDMLGSWATRVYWGYIGEEDIPYTWFDDFRIGCGTEYNADFTPRDEKAYHFTKKGYYRFVLKCIISGDSPENYDYKDMVYTFYYDGKVNPAVPYLKVIDGNKVQIEKNGLAITKLYYGNIGLDNEPYGWFNDFWGKALANKSYKVDYGVSWNEQYILATKGFYNFVIVYKDSAGATHEIVYTVEAKDNIGIITSSGATAVLNVDDMGGKVNKLYWGYIGESAEGVVDFDTLKAKAGTLTGDWSMRTGRTYNLTKKGYYGFCVNYTTQSLINGNFADVNYDIIYIVENK